MSSNLNYHDDYIFLFRTFCIFETYRPIDLSSLEFLHQDISDFSWRGEILKYHLVRFSCSKSMRRRKEKNSDDQISSLI